MASITDAFNEALSDEMSFLKILVYGAPVFYLTNLFIQGKTFHLQCWGTIIGVILFALLTAGINNVRMNRREILTFNVFKLAAGLIKGGIVLAVWGSILGIVGFLLTSIKIPLDFPHSQLIYEIIIWVILGSFILTAYLSFAKYMKILQGFNLKVIFESCMDVLISVLFLIPQFAIADVILVGPVVYLFSVFNLPYTHWGFVAYCSAIFIINVSMVANYFAQISYEHIKGNNEEYQENVNVNLIDDVTERFNGR